MAADVRASLARRSDACRSRTGAGRRARPDHPDRARREQPVDRRSARRRQRPRSARAASSEESRPRDATALRGLAARISRRSVERRPRPASRARSADSRAAADADVVARASRIPDTQVRRRLRCAPPEAAAPPKQRRSRLADASPIVRIEALRALRASGSERLCPASIAAARRSRRRRSRWSRSIKWPRALVCRRRRCARTRGRTTCPAPEPPRAWHPTAHALVALAAAAPDRARRRCRRSPDQACGSSGCMPLEPRRRSRIGRRSKRWR